VRRASALLAALVGCGQPEAATTGVGTTAVATTDADTTDADTTGHASTSLAPTSSSTGSPVGDTTSVGDSSSGAPDSGSETGPSSEHCPAGEMRVCFEGGPGSQPTPPCQSGMQVCELTGAWGPCHGDVLPRPQDCLTPEDETCSDDMPACAGAVGWARTYPTLSGAVGASALAFAADGDIVAVGNYQGTLPFGDDQFSSIGDVDVWIARFAPDGAPKWFRSFGGPDDGDIDYSGAHWSAGNIALDPGGDILVAISVIDAIDFGDGLLFGDPFDPAVLRLTGAGEVLWAHRHVGLGGEDYPLYVAAGKGGKVWLAGTLYAGSIDLGGGVLHTKGWGDVLLAQFDAAGKHLWSRRHGDGAHQEVTGVARAPDGGVVLTGIVEGTLDLGGGPLHSAGQGDAYVARLDDTGVQVWARRYGDKFYQTGVAVQVDSGGGVALAGQFYSTIDLGGGPLASPDAWAIFLARLNPSGNHVWSRALIGDDDNDGVRIASFDLDDDGGLVLAGYGAMSPNFIGNVWGSGDEAWIASLAANGSPRWLQSALDWPLGLAGPNGSALAFFTAYDIESVGGLAVGDPGVESLVIASFGP